MPSQALFVGSNLPNMFDYTPPVGMNLPSWSVIVWAPGLLGINHAPLQAGRLRAISVGPGEYVVTAAPGTYLPGANLFYDASNKIFTLAAAGNIFAGVV